MGGHGSGGHNRLPVALHLAKGTYRPDRDRRVLPSATDPVSVADRRRVLAGLPPEARRVVGGLLDAFDGWHAGSLATLRQYGISCARLAEFGDDDEERRREIRVNVQLLKALDLDGPR